MSRSRIGQLLAAFRYSDFRVLWISTVSNQLGQGMQQVLLGWLVFEITGSGAMVGAVFAARSAPNLVVGFLAGSVTDRLDRRLLIRQMEAHYDAQLDSEDGKTEEATEPTASLSPEIEAFLTELGGTLDSEPEQ